MDHFSSHFRRTKRAAPAPAPAPPSPPAGPRTGSPTDRSSSERKLGQEAQREAPPTLTISTARSSRDNLPSKSPFRRGFPHFRTNHKRARSPAPASLPMPASPVVVGQDGMAAPDRSSPVSSQEKNEEEATKNQPQPTPPKMPAFLAQSQSDLLLKFEDINWAERFRLAESARNPSPTHRFARVTGPEAKVLDRYTNIQPWANTRIKLQVPEGHLDYINASPIVLRSPLDPEGKHPHKYIAMQGPKFNTVDHVWRMVAEQLKSPAVIVMLTETYENGHEKCFPYFPHTIDEEPWEIGEGDEFGDGFRAQLSCVGIEEHANGAIEVRQLKIHVEGREEDMTVWHLLYRKWPDFGVPALEDINSFFELMRLSREKNANEDNPRIIHCSAGVGRSGTFMALEHLMREIDSGEVDRREALGKKVSVGDDDEFDIVYHTVDQLRQQRKQMVQSEPQYVFIYQVLRKLWLEKHGLTEQDSQEPAAKRLELGQDPFDME